MLSKCREDKIRGIFRAFDCNGNGYVDKDDCEAIARRAGGNLGYAPESQIQRQLRARYIAFWDDMARAMDQNKDGRVDPAEFLEFFTQLAANPTGPAATVVVAISEMLFTAADQDGNGSLSLEEFVSVCNTYLVDSKYSSRAFHQLDKNSSETITHDEFNVFIQQILFSDNPNDAGGIVMLNVREVQPTG